MALFTRRAIAGMAKFFADQAFDSTCTVLRAPRVDDGQAGATQDRVAVNTLDCLVGDGSVPTSMSVAQQPVGRNQKILCFPLNSDVQWDDWLQVNGSTYSVIDFLNQDTFEVWLRVLCERMEAGVAP